MIKRRTPLPQIETSRKRHLAQLAKTPNGAYHTTGRVAQAWSYMSSLKLIQRSNPTTASATAIYLTKKTMPPRCIRLLHRKSWKTRFGVRRVPRAHTLRHHGGEPLV